MKELNVDMCSIRREDGAVSHYDYAILVDEVQIGDRFLCESYGVKISEREGRECAVIPNVTTSMARIERLLQVLIQNSVTPCTLADVVTDWLE